MVQACSISRRWQQSVQLILAMRPRVGVDLQDRILLRPSIPSVLVESRIQSMLIQASGCHMMLAMLDPSFQDLALPTARHCATCEQPSKWCTHESLRLLALKRRRGRGEPVETAASARRHALPDWRQQIHSSCTSMLLAVAEASEGRGWGCSLPLWRAC